MCSVKNKMKVGAVAHKYEARDLSATKNGRRKKAGRNPDTVISMNSNDTCLPDRLQLEGKP